MFRNFKRAALAGLVVVAWCASSAQAAQLERGAVELISYEWDGWNLQYSSLAFAAGFNGDLATLDTTRSFEGLNAAGEDAQMMVSAQGTGQASREALKASASVGISGPVLAAGLANTDVLVQGSAWLMQDLVVGNASVTSIRFGLRIDGTLGTGTLAASGGYVTPSAAVALFQGEGLNFSNAKTLYSHYNGSPYGASFDDYVLTNAISVVNGVAALNIQLVAQAAVSIFEPGSGFYAAQSLFNHTASLVEVYGYDSQGAQVALPEVRTSTGFLYQAAPVAAVPEPEQYALLLVGLGVIAGVASRRKLGARRGVTLG